MTDRRMPPDNPAPKRLADMILTAPSEGGEQRCLNCEGVEEIWTLDYEIVVDGSFAAF